MFVEKYDPTIEDSYRKTVTIGSGDNSTKTLEILDTAGTEQFTAMRDMYLKRGDGFLLVYSITSAASLHDVVALHDRLVKVKGTGAKIVLVGNKADLVDNRVVSREQGASLAAKWGCPFVETSARDPRSVDEAFMTLVAELEGQPGQQRPQMAIESSRKLRGKNGKKKCLIC